MPRNRKATAVTIMIKKVPRPLVECPDCKGFGGTESQGTWKVCRKCRGGGRVYAEVADVR